MDPRIDLLLEMLARYRRELTRALEKVPVDVREVRPADGAWSAANVIEHLASTERAITGLVSGFLAKAEPRSDSEVFDRAQFEREIDMRFFLDRSVKVTGPQPAGLLSAKPGLGNAGSQPGAICWPHSIGRVAGAWKISLIFISRVDS